MKPRTTDAAGFSPLTPPTKIRYDGSACLNLRSITSGLDLLEGGAPAGPEMTRDQLTSFLWFVEMCVTSRALFFDGTIPKNQLAKAADQIGRVAKQLGVKELEIEPIRFFSPEDILFNARAALVESSLLLGEFRVDPAIDRPVAPEDHAAFTQALADVEALDERDRHERALALVDQRFLGSKCIAALADAGPQALAMARQAYLRGTDGALVTAGLVNRFRLNYLNQLASGTNGAFSPDPGFESLTDQHMRLFKDFLLRQLAADVASRAGAGNILAENMRQDHPYPPIGLYSLMLTRGKGAAAVLTTALTTFKHETSLQKLMWEETAHGLRMRQAISDRAEYVKAVEAHFAERYERIGLQAAGVTQLASPGQTFRKYLIPAFLGTVGGLLPVVGGAAGAAALVFQILGGTAVGASMNALGDRLTADGCNSYISQYRHLRYRFEETSRLAQPISAVTRRVEEVFGRSLA